MGEGVYPYECMGEDDILPKEEDFYIKVNLGKNKNSNYSHEKRFCKDFEIKSLGKYHDLYLKSNTFVLVDAFENS